MKSTKVQTLKCKLSANCACGATPPAREATCTYVCTCIRAHKSGRWWRGSVRPQARYELTKEKGGPGPRSPPLFLRPCDLPFFESDLLCVKVGGLV